MGLRSIVRRFVRRGVRVNRFEGVEALEARVLLSGSPLPGVDPVDHANGVAPVISIESIDPRAKEGTPANTATFQFTRTGDASASLDVTVTIGGTATAGEDYQPLSTTVSFPATQSTTTVSVTPLDDAYIEGSQSVVIGLVDGAAYDLDPIFDRAGVAIEDNEAGGFTAADFIGGAFVSSLHSVGYLVSLGNGTILGGELEATDGTTETITGGDYFINPDGTGEATVTVDTGSGVEEDQFVFALTRDGDTGVGREPTFEEDDADLLAFIQRTGETYQQSDLTGGWFFAGDSVYAQFQIDAAGNLSGTATTEDGTAPLNGGTVTVTADGEVTIDVDTGDPDDPQARFTGYLNRNRDVVVAADDETNLFEEPRFAMMVRKPTGQGNAFLNGTDVAGFGGYDIGQFEFSNGSFSGTLDNDAGVGVSTATGTYTLAGDGDLAVDGTWVEPDETGPLGLVGAPTESGELVLVNDEVIDPGWGSTPSVFVYPREYQPNNEPDTVSIGNLVWEDVDLDGVRDGGEPGVAGVTVNLLDDQGGSTGTSTVTDASGAYRFDGLQPGSYIVEFVRPTGFAFADRDAGANDALDSDADPHTGRTGTVTVNAGGSDLTVDAGMIETQWVRRPEMITARDQFAAAVVDGQIYVFGGNGNPNGVNLISGERYDPATGAWTSLPDNFNQGGFGVEELTGVSYDGDFYAFGAYGWNGTESGNFRYAQRYDVDAGEWQTLASKLSPTSASKAVAYDGEIFLFGGYLGDDGDNEPEPDPDEEFDGVEAYNPATDSWRTVTTMPQLVINAQVAVVGDMAYVFGGATLNPLAFSDEVMAYDFTTDTWHRDVATLPEPVMYYGNYSSGAPVIGGKVYLVGAATGTGLDDISLDPRVDVFDPVTGTFSTAPSLPTFRDSTAALALGGQLYLIGGAETDPNDPFNTDLPAVADVWSVQVVDPVGSIGDFVWDDLDRDGVQDAGEPGLGGVMVHLLDDQGGPTGASTVSDGSGAYRFDDVPAGDYQVQFIAPQGYELTMPDVGADDAADSDADPATGIVGELVTVTVGGNDTTVDAGFVMLPEVDFGDAPDGIDGKNYPTLDASGGARHEFLPGGLTLGDRIDGEDDGQPHSGATGDDAIDLLDEDGIAFTRILFAGRRSEFVAQTSGAGKLDAWIDFNGDGDWNDLGEQVADALDVVAGLNTVQFRVPSDAAEGQTFGRFRLSTAGGLPPTGQAPDGEVEDHAVSIETPARPTPTDGDDFDGGIGGYTTEGNVQTVPSPTNSSNTVAQLTEGSDAAIDRQFTLPADNPELVFDRGWPVAGDGDALVVTLDDGVNPPTQLLSLVGNAGEPTGLATIDPPIDLSAWAGQAVTIEFRLSSTGNDTGDDQGQVIIDNIGVREKASRIVAHHLFFNDSSFDNDDPAANADDDAAIAPKLPLRSGQSAGLSSITSFAAGINGVMVDIAGLPDPGAIAADDFQFRVGNDNSAELWPVGPAPASVTVRPGEGVDGSDQITIIWPNGSIVNEYLSVTVLANDDTALPEADVFYFASAVGESANSVSNLFVDGTDLAGVRDNPRDFTNRAGINNRFDFNRDGFVDGTDFAIARDNPTDFVTAVRLIETPAGAQAQLNDDALISVPQPATIDRLYLGVAPGADAGASSEAEPDADADAEEGLADLLRAD